MEMEEKVEVLEKVELVVLNVGHFLEDPMHKLIIIYAVMVSRELHFFSIFIYNFDTLSRLRVVSMRTQLRNARYSTSVPWETLKEA